MSQDMRKSSRIDARHFISYDVLNEQEQVILSGMALSENLSRTGIQITDRQAFPVDAPVRLHLAVGDDVIHIQGKVRHVEKIGEEEYRVGVEFTDIGNDVLQKIGEYYPGLLNE